MRLSRLVTTEDPFHCHKIIAVVCVLNFVLQLKCRDIEDWTDISDVCTTYEGEMFELIYFVPHVLLPLTSFFFHLPQRRVPGRLWPEYRLHVLIFSMRHIAYLLLEWARLRYNTKFPSQINIGVTFTTLAFADIASSWWGTKQSPTIRNFTVHPAVKVFLSWTQIKVTLATMRYARLGMATQFGCLLIIQLNPFLMTLVRRGILSASTSEYIYSGVLLSHWLPPFLRILWKYGPAQLSTSPFAEADMIAGGVLLLRMAGLSKYIAWGLVVALDLTPYQKGTNRLWRESTQPFTISLVYALMVLVIVRNTMRRSQISPDNGNRDPADVCGVQAAPVSSSEAQKGQNKAHSE